MKMPLKNIFAFFLTAIIFSGCAKQDGITPNWPFKGEIGGSGREYAASFTINSKAYVGTGFNNSYLKDFWEYDPAANTWKQKADFGGTARRSAVGFSIGDKGYIGTGDNGSSQKDFWEYDLDANIWIEKGSLPNSAARYSAVAFVVGNKAYVGTGLNTASQAYSDFWQFDGNNWTSKADIPVNARYLATAFAVGGKGYVGLGYSSGQSLSDFYEYDTLADSWEQKASFPQPINDVASFVIAGNAYIYTGQEEDNFFSYNQSSNTWLRKANFTGGKRRGAVGFSVNGRGYVGTGGDNGEYKKDFFEYWP